MYNERFRGVTPSSASCALRQIRHSVQTDTFQTLVVSLVVTRLDYGHGNSVLAGLQVYLAVRRLQSVLNAAARLTYHLRRSDHICDALSCCLHCDRCILSVPVAWLVLQTVDCW